MLLLLFRQRLATFDALLHQLSAMTMSQRWWAWPKHRNCTIRTPECLLIETRSIFYCCSSSRSSLPMFFSFSDLLEHLYLFLIVHELLCSATFIITIIIISSHLPNFQLVLFSEDLFIHFKALVSTVNFVAALSAFSLFHSPRSAAQSGGLEARDGPLTLCSRKTAPSSDQGSREENS